MKSDENTNVTNLIKSIRNLSITDENFEHKEMKFKSSAKKKKKKLIIILRNLFVHDITPFYEITFNQSFIKFVKIEYLGKYNM